MINFTEGKLSKVTGEICRSRSDPSVSAVFVVLQPVVRLRSLPLRGFNGFVDTLKYWGIIWSHRLANYSVPITGSWKQIMHQVTSPPSLDLAHGRGSTKCQIYRGQHSHQDLSPTDNALVSAKEQSEKKHIFDSALKRTQNTSCRCVERNAIAIHKRTA